MHPSTDPATMRRREAEFAKAETAADVGQLVKRWSAEDAATVAAEDWRVREVAELRTRVATLERLIGGLTKATGDALRRIRTEDRAHLLGEVETRGYVSYRGTWDEDVAYERGSMVTCAGSAWIATGPVQKGARPGRAAEWRLAAKGADGKGRAVA